MRKKLFSYLLVFIFFIPVFIFICYAYEDDNKEELSGIYYQSDGINVNGKYVLLFEEDKVYLGLKGDESKDIYNDVHGLKGGSLNIQGKDYILKENKIVINKSNEITIEWNFENGKITVGDGEIKETCTIGNNGPSVCNTSIEGIYKKQ